MRVFAYPADDGGCGHYRIRWPGHALAAQGADVKVVADPDDVDNIRSVWVDDPAPRVVDVVPPDCDVVVLQRPLTAELADAIPHLQRHGLRVVVELDDDFSCIHPRNVSFRAVHPKWSPGRNFQHLRRACSQADWVVVSTSALAARYGQHGRVTVVPNGVPECYLSTTVEPHDGLFVGWTGSVDTHPDDLQQTGGAVQHVLNETGARMAVVGTGRGVRRALRLQDEPVACGWVTLDDYPAAMAQFDVGIVPLEGSAFNEAKSALKMMECAAVGVPVVVSPTPDNLRMNRHGIGRVARRTREWRAALLFLLNNEQERADLSGRGRDVMRSWTIEATADRWWEAWTAPLSLSHAGRRVA